MRVTVLGLGLVMLAAVAPSTATRADTCATHYDLCVNKYGNPPAVCACARKLCLKQVGTADAGPKWNWIPGVNACFNR